MSNNYGLPVDAVSGDTATVFKMTCKDKSTGAIIDLTGCSAKLQWHDADGNVVSRDMTIENPSTSGIVSYQFATGELFAPEMFLEVQITNAGGKTLTSTQLHRLRVREQIA